MMRSHDADSPPPGALAQDFGVVDLLERDRLVAWPPSQAVVTPPIARASSGVFDSSDRNVCHSWPSRLLEQRHLADQLQVQQRRQLRRGGFGLGQAAAADQQGIRQHRDRERARCVTACLAASAMRTSAD